MFSRIARCFNVLPHRACTTIVVGGRDLRIRASLLPPSPSALAGIAECRNKQENAARLLVGMIYSYWDGRPIPTEVALKLSTARCYQLLRAYPVRYGALSGKPGLDEPHVTSPDPESEEEVGALARELAGQLLSIEDALLTADLAVARWGPPH